MITIMIREALGELLENSELVINTLLDRTCVDLRSNRFTLTELVF
jgi:hypothetical protein